MKKLLNKSFYTRRNFLCIRLRFHQYFSNFYRPISMIVTVHTLSFWVLSYIYACHTYTYSFLTWEQFYKIKNHFRRVSAPRRVYCAAHFTWMVEIRLYDVDVRVSYSLVSFFLLFFKFVSVDTAAAATLYIVHLINILFVDCSVSWLLGLSENGRNRKCIAASCSL